MAGTILVAIDFAEPSQRALALAKDLARELDAALCLCHVHEPPRRAEGSLAARRALTQLAEEHGIGRTVLREGDAAREIAAAARAEGATLIAMGKSGRAGFPREELASVADKVANESDIPVLTVRGGKGP